MRSLQRPLPIVLALVGTFLVTYIALIAVVMTYASLSIEFSQSVKSDESAVAILEAQYLDAVNQIAAINYGVTGYATPEKLTYVATPSATARR